MRPILISVPYGQHLVLPGECAKFLPGMCHVEQEGYGKDQVLRRSTEPIEAKVIHWGDVQTVKLEPVPAVAAPVASSPVITDDEIPF